MTILSETDSQYVKNFALPQGLYSFLIPKSSTVDLEYLDKGGDSTYFNDTLLGVILLSTTHQLGVDYKHSFICQDCIAQYNIMINYAYIGNFLDLSFINKNNIMNTEKCYANTNLSFVQVDAMGQYFNIQYQDNPIYNSTDFHRIFIQYSATITNSSISSTMSLPATSSSMISLTTCGSTLTTIPSTVPGTSGPTIPGTVPGTSGPTIPGTVPGTSGPTTTSFSFKIGVSVINVITLLVFYIIILKKNL
uniref:Uncharacterized protein n=1 Tax=Acrobeloides nanus TaxID=290746 RepID=A0A914CHQ1_9BILA